MAHAKLLPLAIRAYLSIAAEGAREAVNEDSNEPRSETSRCRSAASLLGQSKGKGRGDVIAEPYRKMPF